MPSFVSVLSVGRSVSNTVDDSVPIRRRCDKLCTSGFVDDVTFLYNGPYGASCVCLSQQLDSKDYCIDSIHVLLNY